MTIGADDSMKIFMRHMYCYFERILRLPLPLLLLLLSAECGGGSSVDVENLVAGKRDEVYGENEISAKGSLSESLPTEAINFGITPWADPEKLKVMYAPFITYLGEKLNVRVRFMVAQEYHDLVADLKRGIIHIAAFSPGAYSDALDEGIENEAVYIASTRNLGNDYYRGLVITRPEINSLAKLKGKTFAFVEKGSSSGYKFPLALLLQKGIDPHRYFSKVYYLGSHALVVDAVTNGKADAGATWDGFAEATTAYKSKQIHTLFKTQPIPYDAIVVYRKMGNTFIRQVQGTLLALNSSTKTKDGDLVLNKDLGFPYTGYVAHGPQIYDVVRQTSRLVKKYKPPTDNHP
jgi:phosphonate transport system substrate-binding protein